jgi:hypothetical protein
VDTDSSRSEEMVKSPDELRREAEPDELRRGAEEGRIATASVDVPRNSAGCDIGAEGKPSGNMKLARNSVSFHVLIHTRNGWPGPTAEHILHNTLCKS